jgi:hypothetical protein
MVMRGVYPDWGMQQHCYQLRSVRLLCTSTPAESTGRVASCCCARRVGHSSSCPNPSCSIVRFGGIAHEVGLTLSIYGQVHAWTRTF